MKHFFFLFIGILPARIVQAQSSTVLWSDSVVVANTSLPVTSPRVVLLPDGTPLVTWGTSSSASQIWCSRLENGVFSPPVGVVQSPDKPLLFGFGGYDVAVSGNRIYVVFEQTQQGIWLTRSDDAGLTFGPAVQVQGPPVGGFATISAITVDGTGNPVISYIYGNNGATYQVRRSPDGGENFDPATSANAAAPGGLVCECCPSDMVASGDSVWIVFRNNNQNLRDIWVARSTDLAASFDTAADVDATDWYIGACPISGPRIARSNDSLLTAWMSRASGAPRVFCSSVHAGTMQAGQQLSPGDGAVTQTFPDIAALGDTVGLVFVEESKEIVFAHSVSGLAALAGSEQGFAIAGHSLQYPALTFGKGRFHLLYTDPDADQVLYRQGLLSIKTPVETPLPDAGIVLWPNPVSEGFFEVKSADAPLTQVAVLDLLGQKQVEKNTPGHVLRMETNSLRKGLYFVYAKTADGKAMFIKVLLQ